MTDETNTIPALEPADQAMQSVDNSDTAQPMDTSESVPEENKEPEPPRPQFQIEVLQYIKSAQAQNGLRHGDYQRYRQYCSRRLRRIRKSTGFLHARKNWVSKKMEVKHVKDERFLYIPLINAERSWAYAMELKEEINLHQSEHDGEINTRSKRHRFHLIKRLRKATIWSAELEKLCSKCANPKTQLEVEAYSNWLQGTFYLEKNDHSQALPKLVHAKTVYEQLAKVSDIENETLCNERVVSIQQLVRYCQYVIKRARKRAGGQDPTPDQNNSDAIGNLLQSKLDHVLADNALEQIDSFRVIKWNGKKIGVKNEKIRVRLATAKEAVQQLNNLGQEASGDGSDPNDAKQTLFSKILATYDDALRMITNDLRDSSIGQSKSAPALESLREYITYQKHLFTTERNLLLAKNLQAALEKQDIEQAQGKGKQVKKKIKTDDLVNLYDKIIHSIEAQGKLNNEIDENRTNALVCQFKALRCFFVAESYRRFQKLAEAYAMYGQAITRVAETIVACRKFKNDSDMQGTIEKMRELSKEANGKQYVARATALLEKEMQSNDLKSGIDKVTLKDKASAHVSKLVDRLDQYEVGNPDRAYDLVSFPPNFQAVPCKPIYFDLAGNYIRPNDISQRVKSKGLMDRIWGR